MSFPDYSQTVGDHLSLLILVKQVGCHLKPKVFNQLYDRISRVQSVHIHSQQRRIRLRYRRTYPLENNEWGDFQGHRKAVGLICIGKCENENEVTEIYRLYEDLDQAYSHTLYDSRLILFGLNKDGSMLERRLRKLSEHGDADSAVDVISDDVENSNVENGRLSHGPTDKSKTSPKHKSQGKPDSNDKRHGTRTSLSPRTSPKHSTVQRAQNLDSFKPKRPAVAKDQGNPPKPHVLCYTQEDQCTDIEEVLQDYVASLFWILESKRLDRSHERQEKPPLLMTPFEKKDLVGVDTDSRQYKKRCQGRLRKHLGDLCLLSGLPGEALLHYQTSLDILKGANDWMWLGGAYEGLCGSMIAIAQPNIETGGFPRNLSYSSFSVKRGSSASKDRSKPVTLTRSLTNGVDLEDSRQRSKLAVDDIVDKYREAILNYSKFLPAGVIELETSLKACRVAVSHMKYLAAADFLQNVVYINLPLTDDEKIERYKVMADLYDEVGMRRKGALFRRLAGMQCVAMTNPKPTWLQCYHLLIKSLDGYKLSVDPKDIPEDHPHGWPMVQMRVLHEIIFTSRRMGTPEIAIRHLCFLLHTMFHHLHPAERQELSGILESYTSRCEAAPQSLALENGTILPPVPFLRFPVVKSFKVQDAPPHLRPVKLKSPDDMDDSSQNLFIYSPMQQRNKSNVKDVKLIQGDMCGFHIQLYNPMPYELKITNLGLLTEGCSCEMVPQSLGLPAESGPYQVKVTLVPKQPGELTILGYTTKVLGVKSLCRLRDLSHLPDKIKVKVISNLPTLHVTTSLPKESSFSSLDNSDIVVTSGSACVYAGQSVECEVRLTNTSTVPVDLISVSVNSKVDRDVQKETVLWNDENLKSQLPLEPGSQACFVLYITTVTDLVTCDNHGNTAEKSTNTSESQEIQRSPWVLESLLRLQYSGGSGLSDEYCRQCGVALTTEIQPSLAVRRWDIIPSDSITHCLLVLDIENLTHHTLKILNDDKSVASVGPDLCQRCTVQIPKCNTSQNRSTVSSDDGISVSQSSGTSSQSSRTYPESSVLSWQQRVFSEHIQNFVDVRWKLPCEGKEGQVSLDGISLTTQHITVLHLSHTHWELSVGGQAVSNADAVSCLCGEPVDVRWRMDHKADYSLSGASTSLKVYEGRNHGNDDPEAQNVLHSAVLISGSDTLVIDKILPEDKYSSDCSLFFLAPGTYHMEVVCEGQGHYEGQGQQTPSDSCLMESGVSSEMFDSVNRSPVVVIDVGENLLSSKDEVS